MAGLATGFLAWGMGEWSLRAFAPVFTLTPEQHRDRKESADELHRQYRASETRVALVTYAALGGMLGFGLGLAGGLARQRPSQGVKAALVGLVLGIAAEAAVVRVAVPYYQLAYDQSAKDLLFPLIMHGAIWTCAGVVGGGAFGLGLGGGILAIRGAIGGALGALIGTIVYEFLGALLFPLALTTRPVSEAWESRMLGLVGVAILASIGAHWAAGLPDSVPAPPLKSQSG